MRIVDKPLVWDLHIHTNSCTKGSSEFAIKYKNKTVEYIDNLLEVFNSSECEKPAMISFTDHNLISIEVYNEFLSRGSEINLLVGVEIDYVTEYTTTNKHLIAYFDINPKDKKRFEMFANELNNLLTDTRKNEFMEIQKLLRELVKLKVNFVISPHAFKQLKRDVNLDWSEKELTEKNLDFYLDSFFCFWESSGSKAITEGTKFLERFNIEDKISFVTFSDSNNFNKLKDYLSNPPQRFLSLPTYKGLSMIATERNRITNNKDLISRSEYGNRIGRIEFQGNIINLSPHQNSIIGGRGSGKSLLLDSVSLKYNKNSNVPKLRRKYIENIPLKVYNFHGDELDQNFSFDVFEQSYVSDLFSKDDFGAELEKKFSDAFLMVEEIDYEGLKSKNDSSFKSNLLEILEESSENLKGFDNEFNYEKSPIDIKIFKKNKFKILKNQELVKYDDFGELEKTIIKAIPDQIKDDKDVLNIINKLMISIGEKSFQYNEMLIKTKLSKNKFKDIYFKFKEEATDLEEKKTKHKEAIVARMNYISNPFIERISILRAYLNMQEKFKSKYINEVYVDGSIKNKFIFTKELVIESPVEHLYSVFDQFMSSNSIRSKQLIFCKENFKELADLYLKGDTTIYKEGCSLDKLTEKLLKFELTYETSSNIYSLENNDYKNLNEMSPGTKTNLLMEYIVFKDTEKPLLIDQPEDNIDNNTIYKDLKKWFSDLKSKRQVIVVTHDANIVINSDSENVIISNQISDNEFTYDYGALEYNKILDSCSTILDGGYEAVEKRMRKYESR